MHRSMRLSLVLVAVVGAHSAVQHAYVLFEPIARWDLTSGYPGYLVNPRNWSGLPKAAVIDAVKVGQTSGVTLTVQTSG